MRSKHPFVILVGFSLWLWVEAPFVDATELVREEAIPIRAIIANPQAFNMRAVRIQGTVQTLERIPRAGGCGLHDAFLFTLNDQTGELPIIDLGDCLGKHPRNSVKPLLTEFAVGDSVEVVIDVSLLFSPNFDSRKLEGKLRWVKRISNQQVLDHGRAAALIDSPQDSTTSCSSARSVINTNFSRVGKRAHNHPRTLALGTDDENLGGSIAIKVLPQGQSKLLALSSAVQNEFFLSQPWQEL